MDNTRELNQSIQSALLDNALAGAGLTVDKNSVAIKEDAERINLNVNSKEREVATPILVSMTETDRDRAVKRKLIPEAYKDAKFDIDKIKSNIIEQNKKMKGLYTIHNFNKYTDACAEIISSLRAGILPRRSWLIGAPNGFGKRSFVSECLLIMLKQGWTVAPYISLHELAEIRVEEEQRLMRPFSYKATQGIYDKETDDYKSERQYYFTDPLKPQDIVKKPTLITSNYSWSEYINAECLFVHFTDVMSKDLESHVLYQLLSIRGAKGLPTIAMISTSLDPYTRDIQLRELVWDEILAYDDNCESYDRVTHTSCYKKKNISMMSSNTKVTDGIAD